MKIILVSFVLSLSVFAGYGQDDLNSYLKTHRYPFSFEKGFDHRTADTLQQKLSSYKLILQAEGGSHFLNFYSELTFTWLKFLNEKFRLTHFFLEAGHSSDLLLNHYLHTGDTSFIYTANKTLWNSLFAYNASLDSAKKIRYFGIDFERTGTYIRALKLILPVATPPEKIRSYIDLIKNADDSLKDCDHILSINSKLKKSLSENTSQFAEFLGERFSDFKKIVLNNGNCKSVYKDRNGKMASNFISFDKDFHQAVYFGELGEAHTVLLNKNFASIVNDSEKFKNKVCVINLYCYNCTTVEEEVSNWPLKKIEPGIIKFFLPFCTSDFTLFDLSGNSRVVEKYRAYGQFLIIAKDQK